MSWSLPLAADPFAPCADPLRVDDRRAGVGAFSTFARFAFGAWDLEADALLGALFAGLSCSSGRRRGLGSRRLCLRGGTGGGAGAGALTLGGCSPALLLAAAFMNDVSSVSAVDAVSARVCPFAAAASRARCWRVERVEVDADDTICGVDGRGVERLKGDGTAL